MLKNYILLAYRNLIKTPFYSIINVVGLAIAIGFVLLITGYVWSEWNVNRDLKNADSQYIIQSKWKDPNQGIDLTTFGPLAKALYQQFPDLVKNYYRWDGITSNVTKEEKAFREGLQVGDSTFLEMYGFQFLSGDLKTAFHEPYSLVITDEKAKKYFNRVDVVGERLAIENFSGAKHDFKITGVVKKPGRNSVTLLTGNNDNQFYISSSNLSYFGRDMEAWQNQYIVSYLELKPGVTPDQLMKPIEQLINLHVAPAIAENVSTYLVPLNKYYLSASNNIVKKLMYTLGMAALFILLMAIINFINLSISRGAGRMREIGVRKVMGGRRAQLIQQFLTESMVLSFFSFLSGVMLAEMLRPSFSTMLNKEIPSLFSFSFGYISALLAGCLIIGLVSGIYPAFVLSSIKSIDSLKGKMINIGNKILLRKSMVGFQFAIALVVFIGAYIIAQQVNYFFSKDLGFDKEYVVTAQVPRNWSIQGVQKMNDIRNTLSRVPMVSNASLSYEVLDGNHSGGIALYRLDRDSTQAVRSQLLTSDEHFASTYGISMAAGDFFSKQSPTDSAKIVINELQANALGWKNANDAIGKQLRITGNNLILTVAGVTKDFNFGPLMQAMQPITFMHVNLNPIYRVLSFRLKPDNISNNLSALHDKWNELMPGTPFEYVFMDEKLKNLYQSEIQFKTASFVATLLSSVIVFLGVLGLIGISLQNRFKEIGIRKVLGSSVAGIILLFIKEFVVVLVVSSLIACPLAWWLMTQWLKAYVYKIELTMTPFFWAVFSLGALTATLISIQTFKTANSNPIKSLRAE